MLSGFVIAYAYQDNLAKGLLKFSDFVIARVIRLYPMMAIGVAIGAIYFLYSAHCHEGVTLRACVSIILTFFCLPSGFLDTQIASLQPAYPLDDPIYSLFWELCVNFAFAFMSVVAGRKTLIWGLVASLVWLCILSYPNGVADLGWGTQTFFAGSVRAAFAFMVGVAIYHTSQKISLGRLIVPLWLPAALLAVVLIINGGVIIGRFSYDMICILIFFPALIFIFSGVDIGKSEKWASERLGELSYPLYAIHIPLLSILERIVNKLGFHTGFVALLVCSAIIMVITLILLRVWDVPVRRFLKQRLSFNGKTAKHSSKVLEVSSLGY